MEEKISNKINIDYLIDIRHDAKKGEMKLKDEHYEIISLENHEIKNNWNLNNKLVNYLIIYYLKNWEIYYIFLGMPKNIDFIQANLKEYIDSIYFKIVSSKKSFNKVKHFGDLLAHKNEYKMNKESKSFYILLDIFTLEFENNEKNYWFVKKSNSLTKKESLHLIIQKPFIAK